METHRGHVRAFFEATGTARQARQEIRAKRDRYQQRIQDALTQGIRTRVSGT